MINTWIGTGRLTRDPELKYTPKGTAVCKFTLAINRKFNKAETDYIDIVAWNKTAEFIANYVTKGNVLTVQGTLQIRSYEAKDGSKRKAVEIVADNVEFGGNNKKSSGQSTKTIWDDLAKDVSIDDDDTPF